MWANTDDPENIEIWDDCPDPDEDGYIQYANDRVMGAGIRHPSIPGDWEYLPQNWQFIYLVE
jgi:hypothetical protein